MLNLGTGLQYRILVHLTEIVWKFFFKVSKRTVQNKHTGGKNNLEKLYVHDLS